MLIWVLLGLLALFVVYLVSTKWFCSIVLSKDVVPLDLVALLLTSFVTIFLGYYITKKLTESRVEKDSLIQDLNRIESNMYTIQDMLKYDTISIEQITNELNLMALSIKRFKQTLLIIGEKGVQTNSLEDHFFELYTLATNFDGNSQKVQDMPEGRILQYCDEVLIATRTLIHQVNTR